MSFFLQKNMVKMRYNPIPYDFKATLIQLLKQIWNFNIHSDKYECPDCLAFEEWCIDFAKTKWEPNFIDFAPPTWKQINIYQKYASPVSAFFQSAICCLIKKQKK